MKTFVLLRKAILLVLIMQNTKVLNVSATVSIAELLVASTSRSWGSPSPKISHEPNNTPMSKSPIGSPFLASCRSIPAFTFSSGISTPHSINHVYTNKHLKASGFNSAASKNKSPPLQMSSSYLTVPPQKDLWHQARLSRNSIMYTVMVRRNRQSAAFREGSQLIFSGSIVSTFAQALVDEPRDQKLLQKIPAGAIVAVAVSRDSPSGGSKSSSKGSRKSDFQTKNKMTRSGDDNKDDTTYPHYGIKYDASDDANYLDVLHGSQFIGYGVYNPYSLYRVRILSHDLTKSIQSAEKSMREDLGKSEELGLGSNKHYNSFLASILRKKFMDAMYLRLSMNLPSPGTTDTYRLFNGEGDGLSGLAVDILGSSTAIVMSSAAWCEIYKETILAELETLLRKQHPAYTETKIDIVWRNTPSRLKQDGYEVEIDDQVDADRKDTSVIATESSVKYLTYPYSNGQKTGFYCDQRDNRIMVAELCKNKHVLDLCCYNGGFALNAMIRGHAKSALGVDSSQDAIDAASSNAVLNGLNVEQISFVREDISVFMKDAIAVGEEYDLVVLDPPKLAPSLSSLDKASRKYHSLNRDAINLINKEKGGLLLTCTCSAAMTQKDGGQFFLKMVNNAALSAKRRVTLLRVSGAASCHTQSPASFPAGAYLTAALFHVGPASN